MKCQPNRNPEDAPVRPPQVHRTLTAGSILMCVLFVLSGCDREPGIIVNIATWPDGVERIRVRTSIGETRGTDIFLSREQTRFAVRVPVGSQGTVQIDAVGLDPMGCKLVSGSLTEPVPENLSRFVERTLELLPKSEREPIFSSQSRYTVGNKPSSIAVADFNGDQKLDLMVANMGNSNVSLLLGDGQGAFGPLPTNSTMGVGPYSVVVGDFNGDQKLDVATANFVGHDVSVRLGTVLGGLSALSSIPIIVPPATTPGPNSIAVGELDGDSKLDLVVTKYLSNEISVLRGDGLGGFSLASTFCSSDTSPCGVTRPYGIAVTDLDGDRNSDLVFTNYVTADVSVMRGNGSGGFSWAGSYRVGDYPEGVAVADLNRDGRPDLVTANSGKSTVSVLLNLSGGLSAAKHYRVGMGPIAVAVADFNADQLPDLAIANYGTAAVPDKSVSVLVGDGEGCFGPDTKFAVGLLPQAIAVGDFDGDGKPDIAVANSGDLDASSFGTVSILLNRFEASR